MDPATLSMIIQGMRGGGGNSGIGEALPGFFQYMFGDSGKPFREAGNVFKPYYEEAKGYQNPFYNAGTGAIGNFQDWLGKMKEPSSFINNLMDKYQESPWARYQKQQSMRALENAGSASGLTGSTPLMLQAQQNASNISSEDMNTWLQNVLGINTQYGQGVGNLMTGGQHAGDILSELGINAGKTLGAASYGEAAGEQSDKNALWGSIAKLFGG